jgi:DnaK suppressor protein
MTEELSLEWMTREEIAARLGIVVNSVRGKVKKGQIERQVIDGKNLYRIVDEEGALGRKAARPAADEAPRPEPAQEPEPTKPRPEPPRSFNPKEVLLEMLANIKVGRGIDAIEKGDEIDLAAGEISRELDAKISMRQLRQLKEIEEALERLKYGEYGTCEECGENIPEQRLRLFPAAKLCVRCQEEVDRHEKIRYQATLSGGTWRDDSDSSYSKGFDD